MDARDSVPPPTSVQLLVVSIARGWFNCALSALLLCRSLSNIDPTSILTTKQRQAAVELFHGIDVDKDAMLSQEVSPLAKRLTISLK